MNNNESMSSDEESRRSSLSESSSSWDEESQPLPRPGFSFEPGKMRAASDGSSFQSESFHNSTAGTNNASVPADQERQLLLLMLLGQVCALHDPTPRTFTVHVLELFERGILDRQSIQFLYELGLVPSVSPTRLMLTAGPVEANVDTSSTEHQGLAIVPTHRGQRSMEASAIRLSLERQEHERLVRQPSDEKESVPKVSFAAEHHPLSLSRYQREFEEIGLLSSGSFGQVYQATNKMDGRDYAIKRVPFNASGYSSDSVQQVVHEVHCLAVCDHPHVVRYYTSWLEPSWMTGSSVSNSSQTQKLLTDIQQIVHGDGSDRASDDLRDYFKTTDLSSRRRRFSFGNDIDETSWNDESQWTIEQTNTRDDSFLDGRRYSRRQSDESWQPRRSSHYRYQICLFIQMQLCQSTTLADWIRDRNNAARANEGVEHRLPAAAVIFRQIAAGLSHVHKKGILHRDLKPANVFASNDDDGLHFKIGDFGLSKLLQYVSRNHRAMYARGRTDRRQVLYGQDAENAGFTDDGEAAWRDPLTAGVGTASYAAPEQVSTRKYGHKADIFSMGLMLLELLCSFSTEHERLQTFSDCRHRRTLPEDFDRYPLIRSIILECTDPSPKRRPTAEKLAKIDLMNETACTAQSVTSGDLADQLAAKDAELQRYREKLAEKQQIIDGLQSELQKLKTSSRKFHLQASFGSDTGSVPASTSSSEDEL